MLQHSETKSIVDDSELNVWTSSKGYAVLRYHPALHLFAGIFSVTIPESEDTKLWDEDGDIEFLRENYKYHHATLKKILEISKSCDRWRLGEVPDLPTWTSKNGRLVLLGDSAHGMFPDAAQGFSMIVEDVAVLSYLLSKHLELGVPEVTRLWEEVYSQGHESEGNREATEKSAKTVSLKDLEPDREADFMSPAFLKWAWGYDAVAEMKDHLKTRRIDVRE
ncbi:FAD-dependent monooxygenase OpS4 [Pseudocercospora fuligena]|uniref:FAD-dependent monooxygenase OpS4 n=1 Tax=Pseudocercospora fuligena TaxID=685502 RepID=A0A8H6R769_9PEZI|nr:FAD-dependent monooxygenase OpS4 [Pseudocercospora fuligena]